MGGGVKHTVRPCWDGKHTIERALQNQFGGLETGIGLVSDGMFPLP